MANAIYPKYKEALLSGSANVSLTANSIKVALVDTGTYTYSATHQYRSDLSGVTASSAALDSKTVTNGLFDAANATFTAVSGTTSEALVFYVDTGNAAADRLIYYYDTGGSGLPVIPNGGDINIGFSGSGIFQL